MSPSRNRDPRTKQELLDRMMSFDFDGDIRHLGAEDAQLKRLAPNRVELRFPASDRTFELSVRIPRTEPKSFKPTVEIDAPEPKRRRKPQG